VKFALGLYLALLLNNNMPFKSLIRSIVLIPFIVPTVLSAIAFWWIFDTPVLDHLLGLKKLGLISQNINFLGDPCLAQATVIFCNIWRGIPFIAITLLAGLQTVSPSLYEAATLDGATLADLQLHHLSAAHPDHRGGDDLLGAVHLHRLPADLGDDARRTGERHPSDGDLCPTRRAFSAESSVRARPSPPPWCPSSSPRSWFPGSASSSASGSREPKNDPAPVSPAAPPTVSAATASTDPKTAHDAARRPRGRHSEGMSYLETCARKPRDGLWLPLFLIIFVLLFPFYWMALTPSNRTRTSCSISTPTTRSGRGSRPSSTSPSCCSNRTIRAGCGTRCTWRSAATFLSLIASVLAAYAIVRMRFKGAQTVGALIFLAYLVPPSILFIPLSTIIVVYGPVRHAAGADPDLPDHPDPVLHLAADGLFQDDPLRARGMRADRRGDPLADPVKIILPLAVPGLISASSSPSPCAGTSSSTR
jgi:ABC-type sugar transport system permease subunit